MEQDEKKPIAGFHGTIYIRGGEEYFKHAYQYASTSYPGELEPALIAYPSPEHADEDVLSVIRYAKERDIAVAIRTGGHQYSGASSTSGKNIQINMSKCYKDFHIHEDNPELITAGVSFALKDFNNTLVKHGRFLPHGCCTHVHVGGHAQSGGYGLLGRSFGLFADHMKKIRIITADEKIREVEPGDEDGIFWAVVGGSPGNYGIVTHVTIKTYQDKDFPLSRGLKLIYHYNEHHFKKVLKVIMEMASDPEFDQDYDVFVVMFSGMHLRKTILNPFAVLKTMDEKMRKHHEQFYGHSARKIWPHVIVIQGIWANTKGEGQEYNPKFFNQLKHAAGTADIKSFRASDHLDGPMPISKLMREMLFTNVREFELPFVKRAYFSKEVPDHQKFEDWVVKRIREAHEKKFKLAIQIQSFGGNKSKFYLNGLDNKTALSWRDSNFLLCMDTFGKDLEKMHEYQTETDKVIGHEGALMGSQDRRLLWGSHDRDLHETRQYYYENEEKYQRLVDIKKKLDPANVFTPNDFCVGASAKN